MNMINRFWSLLLFTVLILASCNLPSGTPSLGESGAALTAAAATLQYQLTQFPQAPTTITATFTATNTAIPPTAIPPTGVSNCNDLQFITDVTVPDGTVMSPGENFTKTWRLKNIGTCTWTPSYSVVFSNGNSMSGPATQALSGNVNPGQTVDISVNLTAPGAEGEYTGNYKLRDAGGVLFDNFYVQIEVQALAPLPPAIAQATLDGLSGEDGHVRSDGTVNQFPNVGDTADNKTAEAFVSFDMSGIPGGATITKVQVNFSDFDTLGNPWSISDGCLRAYVQNYGALDAGDFFPGDPVGASVRWCGAGELGSTFEDDGMKTAVQNAVGDARLQFRLQFRVPTTNNNGVADMVRLGTVKLIVTYQ